MKVLVYLEFLKVKVLALIAIRTKAKLMEIATDLCLVEMVGYWLNTKFFLCMSEPAQVCPFAMSFLDKVPTKLSFIG